MPYKHQQTAYCTQKTVGKVKVEVMKERILEINPKAQVFAFQTFYGPKQPHSLTLVNMII